MVGDAQKKELFDVSRASVCPLGSMMVDPKGGSWRFDRVTTGQLRY